MKLFLVIIVNVDITPQKVMYHAIHVKEIKKYHVVIVQDVEKSSAPNVMAPEKSK